MSTPEQTALLEGGLLSPLQSSGKTASSKNGLGTYADIDLNDQGGAQGGLWPVSTARQILPMTSPPSRSTSHHGVGFNPDAYRSKWVAPDTEPLLLGPAGDTGCHLGPSKRSRWNDWWSKWGPYVWCTFAAVVCGIAVYLAFMLGRSAGQTDHLHVSATRPTAPPPSSPQPSLSDRWGDPKEMNKVMSDQIDKMMDSITGVDFWARTVAGFIWVLGMLVLHGKSVTVLVAGVVLSLHPGPLYAVATVMPSMALMMSSWAPLLVVVALGECYWHNWYHALMNITSFGATYVMAWYGYWMDVTASTSPRAALIGMGLCVLPGVVFLVSKFTVWLLGYTEVRHYPDGTHTTTHHGRLIENKFPMAWITTRWNAFKNQITSLSSPVSTVTQPPQSPPLRKKKWRSEWNPNWRNDPTYESKTKNSMQVPFQKLCQVGYFQVLDNASLEPVGMGFPYRGKFITAHHVWVALGKPGSLKIRHVCGDVVKMYDAIVQDSYVQDSDENIDDGVVVASLPQGVKSYHQDRVYVGAQGGPVVAYAYLDSAIVVTMAAAEGNRHWCSTSPGSSGAPILSATGNLVGMHTSGAGTYNVMVLASDLNDMIDVHPENAADSSDDESICSEAHKGGRMGKRRRARRKSRRLPKLWTDEEYDGFIKDGWTPDELRAYAAEWWRTHPDELNKALNEEPGYEDSRLLRQCFQVFLLTSSTDDELESLVSEAKNHLTPQVIGGILQSATTSIVPSGGGSQATPPATQNTPGLASTLYRKTQNGKGLKKTK